MYLKLEDKKKIFAECGFSDIDTGSTEVQIALLSYRVLHLTEHLKSNKKDHRTERALKMLVGKRSRLLIFLKKHNVERYCFITDKFGLKR
jgi:small subunit ribosomal protein S15